jgi:hypothetical protein
MPRAIANPASTLNSKAMPKAIALELLRKDPLQMIRTTDTYGWTELAKTVSIHPDVALRLARSASGLRLLENARNTDGWRAMHSAVAHRGVAEHLTGTHASVFRIAQVADDAGWSVLHETVEKHGEIAARLAVDSIDLLDSTRTRLGESALDVAILHVDAARRVLEVHGNSLQKRSRGRLIKMIAEMEGLRRE